MKFIFIKKEPEKKFMNGNPTMLPNRMQGPPSTPQSWPEGYQLVPITKVFPVPTPPTPSSQTVSKPSRSDDQCEPSRQFTTSKLINGKSLKGLPIRADDLREAVAFLNSKSDQSSKDVVNLLLSRVQSLMLSTFAPAEIKYFPSSRVLERLLDANTTYSAANYRMPIESDFMNIPLGTDNGCRLGQQVRLKHFDLRVRIFSMTKFQDANSSHQVRMYPVRLALWREKVALTKGGACDITPYSSYNSPLQNGYFYWDAFDTAVRNGLSVAQDTTLSAMHSPNVVSKMNNRCVQEQYWHPNNSSYVTHLNAGVPDQWTSQSNVWHRPHDTEIRFVKTWKKGLRVGWTGTNGDPQINRFTLSLLTDKPPAASTGNQVEYYYHWMAHAYYTDA